MPKGRGKAEGASCQDAARGLLEFAAGDPDLKVINARPDGNKDATGGLPQRTLTPMPKVSQVQADPEAAGVYVYRLLLPAEDAAQQGLRMGSVPAEAALPWPPPAQDDQQAVALHCTRVFRLARHRRLHHWLLF